MSGSSATPATPSASVPSASPVPPVPRPRQSAVAPINTVSVEDVAAASRRFDRWLQEISGGVVTLERMKNVAGGVPVVGNVISLVDLALDIKELHDKPSTDMLDWVNVGIDLIGVIPVPPTLAAARMSLRPMLAEVRNELALQMRAAAKGLAKTQIGDALVTLLVAHLNETIVGDLEKFVTGAQERLDGMLKDAGELLEAMLLDMAKGMRQAAMGELDAAGHARQAAKEASQAADILVHDPARGIQQGLWALFHATRAGFEAEANAVVNTVTTRAQREQLAAEVDAKIRALAGLCRGALARLADPRTGQIAILLTTLLSVVRAYRAKHGKKGRTANVRENQVSEARNQHGKNGLEKSNTQVHPKGDGGCKECQGTKGSISFARGAERLTQSDFTLPGLFPFSWTRQYRSDLAAYDDGPLGARWTTPYTTRLDIVKQGAKPESLLYHAADGRTHTYPLPKVGAFHYDLIENLTLIRISERNVTLARGYDQKETYERHGTHFRLTGIVLRNGAGLAIGYDDAQVQGQRQGQREAHSLMPSDIVTYHGDTAHAHVHLTADEYGRIAQIHLVEAGQLSRLLASYSYDEAGDLITATDEHGASRTYTYQHHLLTRYTDRTGRGMNLRWNGDSADAKAIREWADDGSYDTTLEWDPAIRLTYVTDAQGHETGYYYDILGYTYRIRHPDGLSEWFFRDAAKNVIRHLHPDGSVDDYTYDERSNLCSHTRADGSTVHYAYDDHDNLLRIRDAEGGLWQRDYDQPGNLVEETDPLGNKTAYANNPAGLPLRITDARGGTSQLTYNEAGQLTQYADCSGKTSAWHYDDRGQLIRFTDAAGNVTQYRHEAGYLSAVQHADGGREQFEHDAEGRLLARTDGLSRRTTWTYTAAGLIATRTGADGQHLGYRWDRTGRLIALTNENGRATTFAYDPVGRLLAETGFDGRTTAYHYAPSSGVLTHVQRSDRFTALAFDDVGRLTGRRVGQRLMDTTLRPGDPAARHALTAESDSTATHPDDATVHYTQQERFAYNGNGQLILAENEASRLQWFHDAAGNLTREHHHYPFLKEQRVAVWRHEYDVLNQRVATIRPDGHRVGVLTYSSGHVHGVMLDDIELVQIERDSLHREITRVQGNGLTQVQQYDPVGRLTLQRIGAGGQKTPGGSGGSGNPLFVQRDYRYDGAGQLEAIRDTHNGAHSYRYDPVGRLLAATSALGEETFAFDPAGNLLDDARTRHIDGDPARNTQSYTSSIQGRPALLDNLLRDYAGTRYTWDDYGNLVQKQHNGGTTVYTWDGFDRLIQSRDARVTVTYRYDALGRRIVKESSAHVPYNPDAGSGWQELEQKRRNEQYGYGLTLYGWDGDTLAWESSANGGGRTTHYVYEPGSFVPLAQATQAGPVKLHTQPVYGAHYDINEDPLWVQAQEPSAFATVAYYQCDHLGTPQELTDAHGGIAWSAQYRAWGEAKEVISEAARRAGTHNPIRFQGQYADHETGLHYNHHRYYDPQTGRFISKDPIGLAGGINVYQYTPNPVQWIDPLGLSGIDVYRAMKTDSNGAPIAEPTARGLGARPNVDILVDSDGMVHPNTGRMSVAPGSAENLPLHRRPTTLGGKGKDCACRLNTKDLPKGLKYVQDGAAHGTIQPSASMPLPDYQSALGATSNKWVKQ